MSFFKNELQIAADSSRLLSSTSCITLFLMGCSWASLSNADELFVQPIPLYQSQMQSPDEKNIFDSGVEACTVAAVRLCDPYMWGSSGYCLKNGRFGYSSPDHPSGGSAGCFYTRESYFGGQLVSVEENFFTQNWVLPVRACSPGYIEVPTSPRMCRRSKETTKTKECPVGNPVYASTGVKSLVEVDHEFMEFGFPQRISREYSNERDAYFPGFGWAWSLSDYSKRLIVPSLSADSISAIREFSSSRQLMRAGENSWKLQGLSLSNAGNEWVLRDASAGLLEIYGLDGRLLRIANRTGQNVVLEYNNVNNVKPGFESHNLLTGLLYKSGRRIDIYYQDEGWVAKIKDVAGEGVDYGYIGTKNVYLEKVTRSDGLFKKYLYEVSLSPFLGSLESFYKPPEFYFDNLQQGSTGGVWHVLLQGADIYSQAQSNAGSYSLFSLTGVLDEKGERHRTYRYDSTGRVLGSHIGNGYNSYSYLKNEIGGSQYSVDIGLPLGGISTREYEAVGDQIVLKRRTQPDGSGCSAADQTYSYDSNANITNRVDFSGRRTCSAYDQSRNLEVTRLEGLLEADTCPADLVSYNIPANLAPDKAQRKIHTQWHPVWHLKTREAEPKRITTWVYNGQPDPLNNSVEASCAPADALLPDGSKIAVLCKRYEQATADETGNLGFAAVALSTRSWSSTYNQHGQVLSETDPRGKVTSYEYWADTSFPANDNNPAGEARGHTLGDLKTVTRPGNQISRHTHYNKRGQVLRTELPNGGVEEREYHLRGWLTKVKQRATATATASLDTQYEYYPTGLLKLVTQADGSWQLYLYDDAHRLTDVSDSLGNKVHYTLDNAGNATQESHTDPSGVLVKAISRTYDTLGRLQSQKLGAP